MILRAGETYSPFCRPLVTGTKLAEWFPAVGRVAPSASIKIAIGSPGSASMLSWTRCQHCRVPDSPGVEHISSRGGGDRVPIARVASGGVSCRAA